MHFFKLDKIYWIEFLIFIKNIMKYIKNIKNIVCLAKATK